MDFGYDPEYKILLMLVHGLSKSSCLDLNSNLFLISLSEWMEFSISLSVALAMKNLTFSSTLDNNVGVTL